MSFKLTNNIKKLSENLESMEGSQSVKLTDLMNESFISSCSNFSSLEELIDASGYTVESKEDFAAIPDDEWDEFIKRNTSYDNWVEMQKSAGVKYAKAQMLKGLK